MKTHFVYPIFCIFFFVGFSCRDTKQADIRYPNYSTTSTDTLILPSKEKQLSVLDSFLQQGQSQNASLWFRKANLSFQLGKKDSAIIFLEKTLAIEPHHTDATFLLAYLYADTKNKKALTLCRNILKGNKPLLYPKAHYILGVYYSTIGNSEKAISEFDLCIQNDWTFLDAYFEKGVLLLQSKQYTKALAIFSLAMKTNNKNAEVYYWLGRTNEALKNVDKAVKYYKQCLLLDPSFDLARTRLTQILRVK